MPTARHPVGLALLAFLVALPALAQDAPPVPKMFQGLQGQKGQWQMEFLEGSGREGKGKPPTMTLCTDNLMRQQGDRPAAKAESQCKRRLLKDTPDEAVMESVCPDSKSVVSMTREGPKSMLMSMTSTSSRGERTMKMRYTHLGPCREGQGTVSVDPNSEQCRKLKARVEKMDPEKSCAKRKADREECEQRMRDTAAKLSAMCK
jgi:hypothetical protein